MEHQNGHAQPVGIVSRVQRRLFNTAPVERVEEAPMATDDIVVGAEPAVAAPMAAPTKHKRSLSDDTIEMIGRLAAEGKNAGAISKTLGITYVTARKYMNPQLATSAAPAKPKAKLGRPRKLEVAPVKAKAKPVVKAKAAVKATAKPAKVPQGKLVRRVTTHELIAVAPTPAVAKMTQFQLVGQLFAFAFKNKISGPELYFLVERVEEMLEGYSGGRH